MVCKVFSWMKDLGIPADKEPVEATVDARDMGRTQFLTITSQEHYLLFSGFQEHVLLLCLRSEGPQSEPLANQV